MSWYLPYGGFKWNKSTNETVNIIRYGKSGNSLLGYFLEVDLEYRDNLHIEHSDYSLASEKVKVKEEWLSPYCLEIKTNIILKQELLIN